MKRAIAAVCLIALGACGQTQSPEPPGAQPEFLDLLCSAFEHASADALTRAYGANNLAEQMLPGPEGQSVRPTLDWRLGVKCDITAGYWRTNGSDKEAGRS